MPISKESPPRRCIHLQVLASYGDNPSHHDIWDEPGYVDQPPKSYGTWVIGDHGKPCPLWRHSAAAGRTGISRRNISPPVWARSAAPVYRALTPRAGLGVYAGGHYMRNPDGCMPRTDGMPGHCAEKSKGPRQSSPDSPCSLSLHP
jgi:hypothetical protein